MKITLDDFEDWFGILVGHLFMGWLALTGRWAR